MAVFKCKMCGAQLDVSDDSKVVECEYCHTKQEIINYDDEKIATIFLRADELRLDCEFDKASALYETVLSLKPTAEAYWGLVLCAYGIEYVDDPKTHDKVLTCHRTLYENIFTNSNYLNAVKTADIINRELYQSEAKKIDAVQKGIISLSSKEEPYDIFICYKESDGYKTRTKDSVLAFDIYNELTSKGYRVFFSKVSLESKIGLNYEPYIFAALKSSKLMIHVTTSKEHSEAIWVKNEWSRYLKQMESDNTKHIITCYQDVLPKDLPLELSYIQGQDMSKIGAMQDLVHGVSKLLKPKKAVTLDALASVENKKSKTSKKDKTIDPEAIYFKNTNLIEKSEQYSLTTFDLQHIVEDLSLIKDYKDSEYYIKKAKSLFLKNCQTVDNCLTGARYIKEDPSIDSDGSISQALLDKYKVLRVPDLIRSQYIVDVSYVNTLTDFNVACQRFIRARSRNKTELNPIDLDIVSENEAKNLEKMRLLLASLTLQCKDPNQLVTTKQVLERMKEAGLVLGDDKDINEAFAKQEFEINESIKKIKAKKKKKQILIWSGVGAFLAICILIGGIRSCVGKQSHSPTNFHIDVLEKENISKNNSSGKFEFDLKLKIINYSNLRIDSMSGDFRIRNRKDNELFKSSVRFTEQFEPNQIYDWTLTLTTKKYDSAIELWNTELKDLKVEVKWTFGEFIDDYFYEFDMKTWYVIHDFEETKE